MSDRKSDTGPMTADERRDYEMTWPSEAEARAYRDKFDMRNLTPTPDRRWPKRWELTR